MRRAHNSSATPDRRVTALSGAKHRQPAAPPPFRSYGSNGRALRQTMYARKRGTQESCVVSRQRAAASPYCKADNIQIGAQRTLQACRILTAATAAAVALQAAPAYAGQSPSAQASCLLSRSGGTLSIDRAWMEELLMGEVDRRITRMSDEELVATFKEVLQAKLPSNSAASDPATPPSSLQQLQARVQGFRPQWPWQQAPPTADGSSVSMLGKLFQDVGSGTSKAAAAGGGSSEATNASQLEARTSSPEEALAFDKPEEAQSSRLGSSSIDSQYVRSDREGGPLATSNKDMQSDQAGRQRSYPEYASVQPEGHTGTVMSEMSKESQPGRSREREQRSDEAADETGSLLDAVGLPLQLQDDNLPDIAPASPPDRPGVIAVGRVLRNAVAAASGVAAALAESLAGLLSDSQESVQLQLSNIPETAGQLAIVTGAFGLLYLLTRDWLGSDGNQEADPLPGDQQQGTDAADPQVPGGSGGTGILSSVAASIQLLPHLLGFPIALTASEEVLPLPAALAGPEPSPRQAKLSYKGAMLDGLQESRSLYSAQLPGDAPSRQGVKPDQAPPGPPASRDPGVLWQRNRSEPESAPPVASALSASPGEGADGAVLWKRAEPEAPASLTFPGARDESRAPEGQDLGRLGQAPSQRHASRPSALLDNVAPAGAGLPSRLPARQHANGSAVQSARGSGYPRGVGDTSGAPAAAPARVSVRDVQDPWRTSRESPGQGNVVTGSDSPEHWIAVHQKLQDRGEDPWQDEQRGTMGSSVPELSMPEAAGSGNGSVRQASDPHARGGKQSRESNGNGSFARHFGSAGMRGLYDNVEMVRK